MNRPLSLNSWMYVYANPVNLTDPSGHDPWWCEGKPNENECIGAWFEAQSYPRVLSRQSINADEAINFALDHVSSLNGLEDWYNNCANMVSRALSTGGLEDPFQRWNPSDLDNLPAVRAGNSTEYDLFDFLSTYYYFDTFVSPSAGIILRGDSRWESWITSINISKGDVVFYKWYENGFIPDHWSHVAIVSNPSAPETSINGVPRTGTPKSKVLEQSGSLNNFCWPANPNAWPDPASNPECSFGINAEFSAGRSIDDTGNLVAEIAIVHMQNPR